MEFFNHIIELWDDLFLWSVRWSRLLLTFIFRYRLLYCYLLISEWSRGNMTPKTGSMPSPGHVFEVFIRGVPGLPTSLSSPLFSLDFVRLPAPLPLHVKFYLSMFLPRALLIFQHCSSVFSVSAIKVLLTLGTSQLEFRREVIESSQCILHKGLNC